MRSLSTPLLLVLALLVLFFLSSSAISFQNKRSFPNPQSEKISEYFEKSMEEFKKIKKLADAGDPRLQNKIGWMYDQGMGVKQDPSRAVEWYFKSANQGFRQAQINLGIMYEMGRGVSKNLEESNKWYLKENH